MILAGIITVEVTAAILAGSQERSEVGTRAEISHRITRPARVEGTTFQTMISAGVVMVGVVVVILVGLRTVTEARESAMILHHQVSLIVKLKPIAAPVMPPILDGASTVDPITSGEISYVVARLLSINLRHGLSLRGCQLEVIHRTLFDLLLKVLRRVALLPGQGLWHLPIQSQLLVN
jgi:hypothetical protein